MSVVRVKRLTSGLVRTVDGCEGSEEDMGRERSVGLVYVKIPHLPHRVVAIAKDEGGRTRLWGEVRTCSFGLGEDVVRAYCYHCYHYLKEDEGLASLVGDDSSIYQPSSLAV